MEQNGTRASVDERGGMRQEGMGQGSGVQAALTLKDCLMLLLSSLTYSGC